MAHRHSSYSRIVAWLKILLPLIALGVLGTVFLFNSKDTFNPGFSFSRADMATLEKGSFLKNPQINGFTNKGEPFSLIADEIKPQNGDNTLVIATNIEAEFQYKSGGWAKVTAQTALMNMQTQTVRLQRGGQLQTSDGNIATVGSLVVHLSTGDMAGTAIKAQGPLGQVSADDFRIDAREGENRVLWFENNVRMRYDLQNESE